MNVIRIEEARKTEKLPGARVQCVHSENMTLAYWSIEEDGGVPEHRHAHEQVVNVLAGTLEVTVEGETTRLRPGDVVVVPPDAAHSARAVTFCRVLDVFYPVREDFR